MVQVNFAEVINLEHFTQIATIANFQFQVLPHGQYSLSFSQLNQPKIQFLRKEIENTPWKLVDYEFIISPDKIPEKNTFFIQFKQHIDNQGNLILLYAIIHSDILINTLDTLDTLDALETPFYYTSSHNYGKTWSKSTQISPKGETWIPSGNLVMLEVGYHTGGFLIPVYNPLGNRLMCLTSNDNGKIWNFSLYVEPSEDTLDQLEETDEFLSIGTKDGHVCELSDGNLFLFCHVHTSNELHVAISKDAGSTWTETEPIENFPEMGAGAFDCLSLLELENNTDNLFFLGNKQVGNEFQIVLWTYDTTQNQIVEEWVHPGLFNTPITQLHLFKEDNHIFHITFLSAEQKLYHYEISKT